MYNYILQNITQNKWLHHTKKHKNKRRTSSRGWTTRNLTFRRNWSQYETNKEKTRKFASYEI